MSTTLDIKEIMNRWRIGVKRKMRGVANRTECIDMILEVIEDEMYPERMELADWEIRECIFRAFGEFDYIDADWRPIKVGDRWGDEGRSCFMRRTVTIPKELAGRKVALKIYVGGDALLRVNGTPWHALDPFRHEIILTDRATGGETLELDIEAYVCWHAETRYPHTFAVCDLITVDDDVAAAYYDFLAVRKALDIIDIDAKLHDFLETHLWEAAKRVPDQVTARDAWKRELAAARQQLRETVYETTRFKGEGLMHFVGHSHLDVVFMWPYREFVRKIGRTHATVLRLMERYPHFRFSQSQAKIYADMKEHFPEMFEEVKARIKEGRWEAIGAFWVEPDCNLISGESFVRQILVGQKFFEEAFGFRSRSCWQPDVFGLSWAMPQILARSGIEFFMTNKMAIWNDTNPWTLHNFWWEGMDGSRVFSIVPPGHFIGTVDPDIMDQQWRTYSDKSTVGETLHVYGWGDGGSGPDPEMIECTQRYADFPGLVPTKISSAEEAFESIRAKAEGHDLVVMRDEIYLEEHRGTYTNKAILKKLNRQMEYLYREAELLASLASLEGEAYPADELLTGWKELLTTQFHDSLPGTHVNEVHGDMLNDYQKVRSIGESVRDRAGDRLFGAAEPGALLVMNTLLHARGGYATLPASVVGGGTLSDAQEGSLEQQAIANLDGTEGVLVKLPEIPPVGTRRLTCGDAKPAVPGDTVTAKDGVLENGYLRAEFNGDGELVSLVDKEQGREVVVEGGAGNRFQMYVDRPGRYEAWDLSALYMEQEIDIGGGCTLSVDEHGPVRASLLLKKAFAASRIRQRISLCAGARHLVFETEIDWQERRRLLKVDFPVAINAWTATYDIAYGNMERPAHRNTSYDAAKFEVPAHQWMDMSQADYGVSLMTDCKYGYEANARTMRLTLLKGAPYPDPKADLGLHHFTYVLYPHAGTWREAGTNEAALELNCPLVLRTVGAGGEPPKSFMNCTSDKVTLEAVKQAEDGDGLIVRLVERYNTNVDAELVFDRAVKRAWGCDLMEQNEKELAVDGGRVRFTATPHEIVTLRLAF